MDVDVNAEAKDKKLNRLVALSVVIFSVATGLGNIKDGNIVQAMTQAQANSLDRWNEYQATRTKLHIVETARAQLVAATSNPNIERRLQALMRTWRSIAARAPTWPRRPKASRTNATHSMCTTISSMPPKPR